jgi:O-antigen/teichoic acid export membrane protein
MRALVLLFIAFILISLFSALYFLLKDKGRSDRTVKALTVRVVLSIVLFALLILGYRFGFITQRLGS